MRFAAAWSVAVLLGLIAVQRLWLLSAILRHAKTALPQDPVALPEVLIVAAMRNEHQRVQHLLGALETLDYPKDRLSIVLGDDASQDGTLAILTAWATGRAGVKVLAGESPAGKAQMLNRLIAASGSSASLVAVYDAKHGPAADSLRLLAGMMEDATTGCVSGYLEPANARTSLVSRYAALESWVTQLVRHAGHERQGVSSPSLGGNCLYRRKALEAVGGFPDGALSEDTEVSLAMQALGWRTRFHQPARATNLVVDSLGAFWRQRLRWSSGLATAKAKSRQTIGWTKVIGYTDRLLVLAAALLAFLGWLPWWVLLVYGAAPLSMAAAAVFRAGAFRDGFQVLLATLLLFPVDIAVSLVSALPGLRPRGSRSWR